MTLLARLEHMISGLKGKTHGLKTSCLTLKVLVTTIDAQWEGMGDVGSARYEPALLPPCPTTVTRKFSEIQHFKG